MPYGARLTGESQRFLGGPFGCCPCRLEVAPHFFPIARRRCFRSLCYMLLCDWVFRPHGIDRGSSPAGLLEYLSQLLCEPFVRDVRFADRCQHRPHR
jgi:hypothetical protein